MSEIEISNRTKIVIVSGNSDKILITKNLFSKLGLKAITSFSRGREAVAILREGGSFDLMLVLSHPDDMHWISFLRLLRTSPGIPFVPAHLFLQKGEECPPVQKDMLKFYNVHLNPNELSLQVLTGLVRETTVQQLDKTSIESRLKEASSRYRDGVLEKAKAIYEDIIVEKPDDLVARAGLISTLANDAKRCLEQITIVLQQDPQNYNFHFEQANYFLREGKYDEAASTLDNALEKIVGGDEKVWLIELGDISVSLRQITFCKKVAEKMLQSRDFAGDWHPHSLLGRMHILTGDLKEARRHVLDAFKISGNNSPEVLNTLGIIAHRLGETKKAIDYYEIAATLSPDDHRIHFNIAVCALGIGLEGKAIEHLNRALKLRPDYQKATEKLKQITYKTTEKP